MKRFSLLVFVLLAGIHPVMAKDFHFHGDIRAAIAAVGKAQHLTVEPSSGARRNIQIDIDMPDTSTTVALLREIGQQAGDRADINFSPKSRTVQIDYKYDSVPPPKTNSQTTAATYE